MTDRVVGRRALLAGGAGIGVLAVLGGGYELVDHDVVPGKQTLIRWTDGCDAAPSDASYGSPGPAVSGSFYSHARRTTVGWTISYPPHHGPGDRLPLILALHGLGGNHTHALGPVPPMRLLAARIDGRALPPVAVAAVDGGPDYWHSHPGDDPMRMLLSEFLPMCRRRGLGHGRIGVTGTSMGGYGALLLAEQHPSLVAAVAPISPAVWTSYAESQNANPNAFTSPADFSANDVIRHAAALRGIPVRVASGASDPFHPGVEALAAALPRGSRVVFATGCHDGRFFGSQAVPAVAFLARYLAT